MRHPNSILSSIVTSKPNSQQTTHDSIEYIFFNITVAFYFNAKETYIEKFLGNIQNYTWLFTF